MQQKIDQTLKEMPDQFILKVFLLGHQAKVKGMLLTEYNEVEQMELFREEGRAEGREEGIQRQNPGMAGKTKIE